MKLIDQFTNNLQRLALANVAPIDGVNNALIQTICRAAGVPAPIIRFDILPGDMVGVCRSNGYGAVWIELDANIKRKGQAYVDQVMLHELAHYLMVRRGRSFHGHLPGFGALFFVLLRLEGYDGETILEDHMQKVARWWQGPDDVVGKALEIGGEAIRRGELADQIAFCLKADWWTGWEAALGYCDGSFWKIVVVLVGVGVALGASFA